MLLSRIMSSAFWVLCARLGVFSGFRARGVSMALVIRAAALRCTFSILAIMIGAHFDILSAETCLPGFSSLDVIEVVETGSSHSFSHQLKAANRSGIFLSRATLNGEFEGQELKLSFHFDFDGVSLPYNIFALLVASETEVLAWHDFTRGCYSPPPSIFPGQSYNKTPAIRINNPGKFNLHIIVWGNIG
jgi:hypothetical protein